MNGATDYPMRLKPGVRLTGLQPQIVLAAVVVHSIMARSGMECIITSANDSTHGANSLHSRDGLCRAMDFRTKNYPFDKRALAQEVRASLGPDFDVVLEDEGGPNEHMHVEYDPKPLITGGMA